MVIPFPSQLTNNCYILTRVKAGSWSSKFDFKNFDYLKKAQCAFINHPKLQNHSRTQQELVIARTQCTCFLYNSVINLLTHRSTGRAIATLTTHPRMDTASFWSLGLCIRFCYLWKRRHWNPIIWETEQCFLA